MKKNNLIIILIIIMIIGININDNFKKYDCVTDYIGESFIDKQDVTEELKSLLNNDEDVEQIKIEEKYLMLGYLELEQNKNQELARKYFELGLENTNKYTCDLTEVYLNTYLSQILIENKEIDKGIEYAEEALDIIKDDDYKKHYKLISNIIKPITITEEGRDIAVKYLDEILEADKMKLKPKLTLMRLLSAIHIMNYDYADAISLNMEMINLNKVLGEDDNTNKYYINKSIVDMSLIARDLEGYKTSMELLNEVSTEEIEDKLLRADSEIYKYINLAQVQNMLGMREEALDSANKINQYENDIPESKRVSISCLKNITIADIYVNDNNLDLAKEYLYKAIDDLELSKDTYPGIEIYYNIVLGAIDFREGKYEEAIDIFKQNLEELKYISNKEYEKICIVYLIELYGQIGDKENLVKYIKIFEEYKDESSEIFTKNYYGYVAYKESYKELDREEKFQDSAIIFLFALIIGLALIVINTVIHPYLKTRKDRRDVKVYLENNNYLLNYQPIINPITNKIKGFESLLRLKIDEKIIYPDVLINQIERSNMMDEVSIWILKQIIKDYNDISKLNNLDEGFYLSMNISLKEIEDEVFCNKLIDIIKDSHIDDKCICLEITENISGKDYTKIRKNIKNLINNKFIIAIDDFGVDYSNLSFLEELEFNIIKLDKYFIDNFLESIVIQGLIDLLNTVSNKKDISVVIEGVEEKHQVDYIKGIKSDKFYIQGYYYSKPVEKHKLNEIK